MDSPRKSEKGKRSGESKTFSASDCNWAKRGSFSNTAAVRWLCSLTQAIGLSPWMSSSQAYLSGGIAGEDWAVLRGMKPEAKTIARNNAGGAILLANFIKLPLQGNAIGRAEYGLVD